MVVFEATSCALEGVSTIVNTTCANGFISSACMCPPPEFALATLFINVEELPAGFTGFVQLMWLFLFYALVLYKGSNMISDGSELLLLVPEYINSALVGSVVLPILGAVPDGAIVLFSGLGPGAQEQLNVGIGGLAGSTIMLLTIPWFLAVLAGRVDVDPSTGTPSYAKLKRQGSSRLSTAGQSGALWQGTGISPKARAMQLSGRMMLGTAAIYLVIQVPAFVFVGRGDADAAVGAAEKWWAFTGMLLCVVAFVAYLRAQGQLSNEEDDHFTNVKAHETLVSLQEAAINSGEFSIASFLEVGGAAASGGGGGSGSSKGKGKGMPLLASATELPGHTREVLRRFFKKYDRDNSGDMSVSEMGHMFADMNLCVSDDELAEAFNMIDCINHDGNVGFEEFCAKAREVVGVIVNKMAAAASSSAAAQEAGAANGGADADEAADEDEPEIPEDLAMITDRGVLARKILNRSLYQMVVGTLLVLLFSDPMVDVFSAIGERTNIPAFYVSFVLAPLASNASELIAAYNYAAKKTKTTITTSLTALQGAACMNNTLCLGIFMALIFFKGLFWEFSAETIAIVLVQAVVGLMSFKEHEYMRDAWLILALYPASIILVFLLENVAGLQ